MSAKLHQHHWIFHLQLSKWLHIIRIQLYRYEYDDPKSIFFSFNNMASMSNAGSILGQTDKDSFSQHIPL